MEMNNKLYGKTIIWNGDSICQGSSAWGNWATRIAERNNMTFKNYGIGGGTVAEGVYFEGDNPRPRHWVSGTVDQMFEEFPNADYIIFEGGTNDADLLGNMLGDEKPEKLGEIDMADYSGNYDRTTFCGAIESIFYRAIKYWHGKKIAYIVAQKMGVTTEGYTADKNNRRAYFELAIKACKKWGIPYIDLWDGTPLNPVFDWQYCPDLDKPGNDANGRFYFDGQHLTSGGYDYTSDIIDSWLKTL